MANEDNLIPYVKGQSGNPNGRPKKFTTILKDYGYKQSEINDTIQNMLVMGIDELKDISQSDDSTILEKTIANALYKSYRKGSLYSIETLLTRVYGKPKEQMQVDSNVNLTGIEVQIIKRER
jgi:hypothetical protein